MYKFSQQLREEAIEHFNMQYGYKIDHAKADDYLLSMAELWDIFAK